MVFQQPLIVPLLHSPSSGGGEMSPLRSKIMVNWAGPSSPTASDVFLNIHGTGHVSCFNNCSRASISWKLKYTRSTVNRYSCRQHACYPSAGVASRTRPPSMCKEGWKPDPWFTTLVADDWRADAGDTDMYSHATSPSLWFFVFKKIMKRNKKQHLKGGCGFIVTASSAVDSRTSGNESLQLLETQNCLLSDSSCDAVIHVKLVRTLLSSSYGHVNTYMLIHIYIHTYIYTQIYIYTCIYTHSLCGNSLRRLVFSYLRNESPLAHKYIYIYIFPRDTRIKGCCGYILNTYLLK